MARIPDEDIERIKQEVSLQRLVEAQGIELKRHGADLLGLCPFHDDHEPSLVVSPKKNLWHCLGACQTGGSVIDWVMRSRGVSFRHAAELLRNEHPSLATPVRVVSKGTTAAVKLEPLFQPNADDQRVLRDILRYYQETLKNSPEALTYLQRRGLNHPEMLDQFHLGFSNRTLGYHLPDKNRKEGAEARVRLQKIGLIREPSGHEHFTGSVVFPILDLEGNILGMYGRKINDNLRAGTPMHTYLPGPHRGVWNELALQVSKEIILCESIIDALTFWCAGFRNVTTSYGINGFTGDHRAAFRKHGVQRVWIAYDRDEAGEKAAMSLAEELLTMGIECFRVLFPKGMDANEYARTTQPAAKALGVALNSAQWLGKGKPPERATVEVIPVPDPDDELVLPPESAPPPTQSATPKPAAKERSGPPPVPEPVFPLAASQPPAVPPTSPPIPSPPTIDVPVEVRSQEIIITMGDRRYRVRGFSKNLSYDLMKVNLLASRGEGFHVDTLNLYTAHQRTAFIKQAAVEMGAKEEVIRHDLGQVLLKLEELQDQQIQKTLEPKKPEVAISDEDRAAALDLLNDPRLLERMLADFTRCGVVGEETNKKVAYLAAVSRLLDTPLAIIIQSSSAAGKSSLMEAVLALMPEEQRVQYSAMTGQSLFYMGETDLKNKILAIVEEEGAQRASYALKLLQSEGSLTIASTGKDPATGKLVTHQYRVEGPVMIFLTTTAIEIDEELLNRCLVLTVDEDREQTRAIHRIQRTAQTLAGLLAKRGRQDIVALHRNAQRLLKPLAVVNPYADRLTFPDSLTRTRRDHMKFLVLIRAITLLHQYQRPVQTAVCGGKPLEYIESTEADVELAEDLITQVLGRSLDELPPQTRRLLLLVDEMASRECESLKMQRTDYRFSRRDVRHATSWSDAQLKRHLHKLEEMEYLVVHRGGRGQSFVYELYFERPADPSKPFLPGLVEIGKLRNHGYDEKKYGPNGGKDGSSMAQVRPVSDVGVDAPGPMKTDLSGDPERILPKRADTGEGPESAIDVTINVKRKR